MHPRWFFVNCLWDFFGRMLVMCTPRPNANVLALLRRTREIPLVACDKESEEAFRRAGITTSGMLVEIGSLRFLFVV